MKYFTIEELTRSSTAKSHNLSNAPNEYEKQNLIKLIDNLLDPIREKWGKPIIVTSGFRSETLNKLVGGVSNSEHRFGMAADIKAKNPQENKQLFDLIKQMGKDGQIKFRQLIWEKGTSLNPAWLHISYNEKDNKNQIIYA